jgi:predicted phage baseplate assembly protein
VALPAPTLDDRRFQDLVDDAKRLLQERCPTWTDHNVHDPGVTLIELFAWMTEQVVYRLNRVPDRHYVKFLELLGVRLHPPTAATTDLTFRLSAPQPEVVRVPEGTEVTTVRVAERDAVTFTTVRDLPIPPCHAQHVAVAAAGGAAANRTEMLSTGRRFACFNSKPQVDDTFLVGLSAPVPSCVVTLRMRCDIAGIGVDPDRPPRVWEALCPDGWQPCEIESDTTGGINRDGEVVVHVPPDHARLTEAGTAAGWLRCRVIAARPGQPQYDESPEIAGLEAFTIGATVAAANVEAVCDEITDPSDGLHGQRVTLKRAPVVAERGVRVEVAGEDGWEMWETRASFAESGEDDRHVVLDAGAGELLIGPAVRDSSGNLRRYGAVPAQGAQIRVSYHVGGGPDGNVSAGKLCVLKTSIPYVTDVANRRDARGGVGGEEIENAKLRAPLSLRGGDRAVTGTDYELLAREAAPELARVRCVPADSDEDAGALRLLVVPQVGSVSERFDFDELEPPEPMLERIEAHLEPRRVIGARLAVEPPHYHWIMVAARVRRLPGADEQQVQAAALAALFRHFHPVEGGAGGRGWAFGRPVVVGDAFSVLAVVPGVEIVEDAQLFLVDPRNGNQPQRVERVEIARHALPYSFDHRVKVIAA